jgi:hypothetical protein
MSVRYDPNERHVQWNSEEHQDVAASGLVKDDSSSSFLDTLRAYRPQKPESSRGAVFQRLWTRTMMLTVGW